MTNEEMEVQDSETPEEEEDTLDPQEEVKEEEEKDYKSLYENQRIRAEKAEKEAKKFKEMPKSELPQSDLIALIGEGITEEDDLQVVQDYAKLKKISIREALSKSIVRKELAELKEQRQTAKATSTGNRRSGTSAPSGDELLRKAQQGDVPEDDEGIRAVIEARYKSKLKK